MAQLLMFPDPRPLVERLGNDFFRQLPRRPGVYLMRDAGETVLYVGKARNLRQRLGHYRVANPERLPRRHLRLLRAVHHIELQECADEAAALAREAELLLALKPRFNRAGVWTPPPRHLVWRAVDARLELAVILEPEADWQALGPFGGGVAHLRAALARLLWLVRHPDQGVAALPAGWIRGRLGKTAVIAGAANATNADATAKLLAAVLARDAARFDAALGPCPFAQSYALELWEADRETVSRFLQAKKHSGKQ